MSVANFLADYAQLCAHHGLCLSHEDTHGGFQVRNLDPALVEWVMSASARISGPTSVGRRLLPGPVVAEEEPEPSSAFDYAVPRNCVLLTSFGNLAKDGERVAEMLNDATASRFVADEGQRPILKMVSGGRLLHHPAGVPAMRKV